MLKDIDINILIRKAEELRALFVLGQRVIPFLEDIFMFVNEIKPLIDEINHSIEENLKKMPNASKQLSKVTEATEMATTEIMDIVDGLIYKSEIINNNIEKLENLATGSKEFVELAAHSKEIVKTISDDSTSIMMSLQVQDITTQQIAAVNHFLVQIQTKLSRILLKFQEADFNDIVPPNKDKRERTNVSRMHRDIAFDPQAVDSYSSKGNRQDDVDAIFNGMGQVENESDIKSPNYKNDSVQSDDFSSKDSKELDFESDFVSQDDIDALFGK